MLTDEQLSRLTPQQLDLLKSLADNRRYNKLDFWHPYPKQLEFVELSATADEALLSAGNQVGKSETGAYIAAMHLTGLYPPEWKGRKWARPTRGWIAGESTTVCRDVAQTKLCGTPGSDVDYGTGFIPKQHLIRHTLARGAVSDAFDTIWVQHHTNGVPDGISTAQFKSYEQGRQKFQGSTIDWIWWDEEPPADVYTEGNARWSATGGQSWMTFTPLKGISEVVARFMYEANERRRMMTIRMADCPFMTPEMIESSLSKYPKHQHEARMNGVPLLGEGLVFNTDPSLVRFAVDFFIPPYWPLLWGIDFGITHPFAAVLAAWDRDRDIIYIFHSYRAADALPIVHAEAIKRTASEVPIAWPHDGHARERGTGEPLAKVYKALGLKMLHTHAQFADGSISTEAAVLDMQQRFADGRLRIREDLGDLFEEYSMYHRKDGLIVKVRDDLISAVQKIIMAKRFAKVAPVGYVPHVINRQQRGRQATGTMNPWTGRLTPVV